MGYLTTLNLKPRAQGDTWPITLKLNRDALGNPLADGIAGWTFALTVGPAENPSSGGGNLFTIAGVIVDATACTVSFTPSTPQAALLVALGAPYWYDMKGTNPAGKVGTLAVGRLPIVGDPSP